MTMTVGIATTTQTVSPDRARALTAALDVQVKRDLKPIWGVDAQVIYLDDPHTVPSGVNPIFISSEPFPGNIGGFHRITQNVTFAFVNAERHDWQLSASHECLEMLVDPSGCKLVPSTGIAIVAASLQDTDAEFQYVLEVCDPVEDPSNAYEIDGISVSDFYTPEYFDRQYKPGVRYSMSGKITRPREILPGGYLSWLDANTQHFLQIANLDGLKQVDRGAWSPGSDVSARMFIDANTVTPRSRPDLFGR